MNIHHSHVRDGSVAVLLCVLIMPLLMLLALSVDYGFLCLVKTDLQRAADQAVVAAARDLVPDDFGDQDLAKVRQTLREYIAKNLGDDFVIEDSDIEIGRYNPETVYTNFELLNNGTFDTVRVTLRRDDLANTSVGLFFARLFNRDRANVNAVATAILQKAQYLGPGTAVLPIGIDEQTWNTIGTGEQMSVYGDGRIEDEFGNSISGNWGTLDIGDESNSTSDLRKQILDGLTAEDLTALHENDVISSADYIDGAESISLNGDPGFSAGIKHAMEEIEGSMKVIPIFGSVSGSGNGATFEVVGWTAVRVVNSRFAGSSNSFVEVRKASFYDQAMYPIRDLSDQSNAMENAYTSPVLVQ